MTGTIKLAELGFDGWLLPEANSPVEFAEKNHVITVGSLQGLYRAEAFPYQRGFLEAFVDPKVRKMSAVWGSQTGKSTSLEILQHYITAEDPGPALLTFPDKQSRDYYIDERLRPAIENSDSWRGHLSPQARAITHTRVKFRRCSFIMAKASSSADLAQKSIRYVFNDEVDKYPTSTRGEASPLKQTEARTLTYLDAKICNTSTPTDFHGAIWREYLSSDQRRWEVPCPACGHRDAWDWGRVEWEERPESVTLAEWANRIEGEDVDVWYTCAKCGSIIPDEKKVWMNQRGLWVPQRADVASHAGFHLPSLASPFTSFRSLAVEYVNAKAAEREGDTRDIEHFTKHRLARPWETRRKRTEVEEIAKRVDPTAKRNVVPKEATLLTLGVDVQHSGCYWLLCAWWHGKDGPVCHVVGHGFVEGGVENMEAVVDKFWHWDGHDTAVRVSAAMVDAGEGLMATRVYLFCNQFGKPPVFPIKGVKTGTSASWVRASKDEAAPHEGRLRLLDTVALKDFLSDRMEQGCVAFHQEVAGDIELQRQLVSEERVVERGSVSWEPRLGFAANHWWDCWVYSAAGAVLGGVIRTKKAGKRRKVVVNRQKGA